MRLGFGGIAFTYQTFNLLKVACVRYDEMRCYLSKKKKKEMRYCECLWCWWGHVSVCVWCGFVILFYFHIKS